MKKSLVGIGVLGLVVLTLGLAGFAYAQGRGYPFGYEMINRYEGHDYGMMGYGYKDGNGFPQDQDSPPGEYPYGPDMMDGYGGYGYGYGMMEDRYSMMGWNGEEGPMHEVMIDTLAQNLNLSPQEIETRHDEGESIWEIVRSEGLSDGELQDLKFTVHDTVLESAVSEGWLTQEQSDWMDEHMNQMWDGDYAHCGNNTWNGAGEGWHGMGR